VRRWLEVFSAAIQAVTGVPSIVAKNEELDALGGLFEENVIGESFQ
jgi:hypothetical protein